MLEEHFSVAKDRPRRDIQTPQRYNDFVGYALTAAYETNINGEPTTYSKAISSNDASKWLIAMNEEIESLHKNGT